MTSNPGANDGLPRYRDLPRAGDLSQPGWLGASSGLTTGWHPEPAHERAGALRGRPRAEGCRSSRSAGASRHPRSPPMFGRQPLRHTTKVFRTGTDDYYDDFYPQASSQWDALSHIGHPQLGYYGGRSHALVGDHDTNPLGIDQWAARGIVGRFVLVDVGRARAAAGVPLDLTEGTAIGVDELEVILTAQGVALAGGDILLLRFG